MSVSAQDRGFLDGPAWRSWPVGRRGPSIGASVSASGTIAGDATGVRRTFTTDEGGTAVLAALPAGRYQIILGPPLRFTEQNIDQYDF